MSNKTMAVLMAVICFGGLLFTYNSALAAPAPSGDGDVAQCKVTLGQSQSSTDNSPLGYPAWSEDGDKIMVCVMGGQCSVVIRDCTPDENAPVPTVRLSTNANKFGAVEFDHEDHILPLWRATFTPKVARRPYSTYATLRSQGVSLRLKIEVVEDNAALMARMARRFNRASQWGSRTKFKTSGPALRFSLGGEYAVGTPGKNGGGANVAMTGDVYRKRLGASTVVNIGLGATVSLRRYEMEFWGPAALMVNDDVFALEVDAVAHVEVAFEFANIFRLGVRAGFGYQYRGSPDAATYQDSVTFEVYQAEDVSESLMTGVVQPFIGVWFGKQGVVGLELSYRFVGTLMKGTRNPGLNRGMHGQTAHLFNHGLLANLMFRTNAAGPIERQQRQLSRRRSREDRRERRRGRY